jgi:ketosteroid isomerase-like protein
MGSTHKIILGAALALGARSLLNRAVTAKLRADVAKLNAGDYESILSGYSDDAVLHFTDGDHRWAGDHVGKDAIARFFAEYTKAGMKGEVTEILFGGPPWAMTLAARFNDWALGPDGEELYRNRVVVFAKTRWGKIVDHSDFYEDTEKIPAFDKKLRELGIDPV